MTQPEAPLLIVTGSTGHLGGLTVRALVTHHPAECIVATTRVPEQADELRALGVQVRWADYEKPESLAEAFVGADKILVISSNARAYGEDPVKQHETVFSEAKKAGAERIVFTSQMAASDLSAFPPMHDYAASELALANCGMPFTIMRNGFYGTSGIQMLGEALSTGQLTTALDGKISWVAHEDLAEAAALILAGEAQFDGATPPLTGPEAFDFGELAEIVSESWLEWGLGEEGDRAPRSQRPTCWLRTTPLPLTPAEAQQKLGKLVNQGKHAAHTASLDQLPDTARPSGPGDP